MSCYNYGLFRAFGLSGTRRGVYLSTVPVSSPLRSDSPCSASDTSSAPEDQDKEQTDNATTPQQVSNPDTEDPTSEPEVETPTEEYTETFERVDLSCTPFRSFGTLSRSQPLEERHIGSHLDSERTSLTDTLESSRHTPQSCLVTDSAPDSTIVTPTTVSSVRSSSTDVGTTTTTTTTTTALVSSQQGLNDNSDSSVTQTESTMGENARVEEKLRQFQQDSKRDDEDTRGTYNSDDMMSEADKQRRRNLIFDEERFEETFLKCLICREVYNEDDKLPKMLHCHHTFCLDCLLQMYRVEGEFRQSLTNVFRSMPMTVKIQCPTCREGVIISEPELRRLPNDHTIMELLFFVNQTGKNEVQYCTKHQMQPLNFFCEPCIMPVCCDCTVIDHKESKGHLVVNVDEAMKKYTPIVEETLGDIRTEKSVLADKRLALENAQDDMDQIQRDLNDQIRSVFDNIRHVLEERERELYDAAAGEIEKKRIILDGHLNVISDRESQLNAQFNELQKAKDERDISQLFSGHKTAREVLARPVFVPTNSTKGFSVTFQFSSRADNVIKQQMANLGDIIFQS